MRSTSLKPSVLIFLVLLCATCAHATNYYIDYSSGNDSASGTSKSSPWQHAPGMNSCSANCAAASPQPGDSILFRGGVTWPNAAFPWNWQWSGSSGSPIYVGVDQTWYAGGSWVRPVFNAQNAALGSNDTFILLSGVAYVTFDNFEFTNFAWAGSPSYGTTIMMNVGNATHTTISNNLFHNWTHNGATSDQLFVIACANTPPYNVGGFITNNIITDNLNQNSGNSINRCGGTISNNVISNTSNGILPSSNYIITGNNIGPINPSFDPTTHENGIEDLGSVSGSVNVVANNYVHDVVAFTVSVGDGGGTAQTYIFNNVIVCNRASGCANTGELVLGNGATGQPSINGGYYYVWNNTLQNNNGDAVCITFTGGTTLETITLVDLYNNYCISNATGGTAPLYGVDSAGSVNVTTLNMSNDVSMSNATASSDGYNNSQTYVFSPTGSGGPTAGKGRTICGAVVGCSGNLAAATSDTTYGCSVDATNHVVCPARTASSWSSPPDVGAYEFGGNTLAPPTNLRAIAQ